MAIFSLCGCALCGNGQFDFLSMSESDAVGAADGSSNGANTPGGVNAGVSISALSSAEVAPPSIKPVLRSGNQDIDGILYEYQWDFGTGPKTLTYSFPTSATQYERALGISYNNDA